MNFFGELNKIAFFLSLVIWAGGGVTISIVFLPLRDPNTQPQIQGFLNALWSNLRIVAVAVSIVLLGTSSSLIILESSVSIFWSVIYFVALVLAISSWYMADSLVKKGFSDPRTMLEIERRNFSLYLFYADVCIVLATAAASLAFFG